MHILRREINEELRHSQKAFWASRCQTNPDYTYKHTSTYSVYMSRENTSVVRKQSITLCVCVCVSLFVCAPQQLTIGFGSLETSHLFHWYGWTTVFHLLVFAPPPHQSFLLPLNGHCRRKTKPDAMTIIKGRGEEVDFNMFHFLAAPPYNMKYHTSFKWASVRDNSASPPAPLPPLHVWR